MSNYQTADREGHGLGYTVPQLEQALHEAVRARTTAESRAAEYLQQVADRDRFIQIDRSIIKQRDEKIDRLQQLLTKAASNGHVLMQHPPYGSSFLDCDLGPCASYRAALKGCQAPEIVERNGVCYEIEYGPGCDNCDGIGAYLEHAPRCSDEFCVGNGDEHSCNGSWLPCGECGTMRKG